MIMTKYENKHKHLFSSFPSSNITMDDRFREEALINTNDRASLFFIFTNEEENILYGYYTLFATALINKDEIGDILARPSAEIGLFAIPKTFENKTVEIDNTEVKFSNIVFGSIIERIENISKNYIGFNYIIVRSTEQAIKLYRSFGFEERNFLTAPFSHFSEGCYVLIKKLKIDSKIAIVNRKLK